MNYPKKQISDKIVELYEKNRFLLKSDHMSDTEKARYISFLENPMKEDISFKLNEMSNYLSRYYGKKVIILLDDQGLRQVREDRCCCSGADA